MRLEERGPRPCGPPSRVPLPPEQTAQPRRQGRRSTLASGHPGDDLFDLSLRASLADETLNRDTEMQLLLQAHAIHRTLPPLVATSDVPAASPSSSPCARPSVQSAVPIDDSSTVAAADDGQAAMSPSAVVDADRGQRRLDPIGAGTTVRPSRESGNRWLRSRLATGPFGLGSRWLTSSCRRNPPVPPPRRHRHPFEACASACRTDNQPGGAFPPAPDVHASPGLFVIRRGARQATRFAPPSGCARVRTAHGTLTRAAYAPAADAPSPARRARSRADGGRRLC